VVLWLVGILLLFPLFFQISGNIYNSFEPVIDSGGVLATLPLPVSIFACFGGILMAIDNYRRAYLAIAVAFSMLFALLISLVFSEINGVIEQRKILLLIQVMAPVSGMILGQMIVDNDKIIPKAFLYVLLLIVPAQLISGYITGSLTLTHNLYLFSIYQHFQYVPLIFVCAYAYTMANLWNSHRKSLYILTPLMFVYATASISFLTIIAFIAFIATFAFTKLSEYLDKVLAAVAIVIGVMILLIMMQAYLGIANDYTNIGVVEGASKRNIDTGQYIGKIQRLNEGKTPVNLQERFEIWKLYGSYITESSRVALLGHNAPLPRKVRTSAHNWYLDMIYNFGLISLLPLVCLAGFTVFLCWQYRKTLPSETVWLAVIVFYLVVIDSNFKVTLREPYPGIFTYFLWGLLLSYFLDRRVRDNVSV